MPGYNMRVAAAADAADSLRITVTLTRLSDLWSDSQLI